MDKNNFYIYHRKHMYFWSGCTCVFRTAYRICLDWHFKSIIVYSIEEGYRPTLSHKSYTMIRLRARALVCGDTIVRTSAAHKKKMDRDKSYYLYYYQHKIIIYDFYV